MANVDKRNVRGVSGRRKVAGSGDIRSQYAKVQARRVFHFCPEPIRPEGLIRAGLIGRLQMQANGGSVLGILFSI